MKLKESQDTDKNSSRGNNPETQRYAETAIKVFDYIYTLPELESSFIFKTLLDEALELASHLKKSEASKQFYKSVCEYCNKDIDITPLCLTLTQNKDKVADAINSIISNDANRLRDLSHTSLPSAIEILSIRDFFVPTIAEKGYNQVKSYFVMMTSGINLKEIEDNFSSEDGIKENIFSFLGYQTIFYNLFIDLSKSKNDNDDRTTLDENLLKELKTFVALYCKGELLYYVYKTIFNTKIIRISLNLWNSILDYCKKDGIFCEIAQKRFNDYQSFWGGTQTSLSNYRFHTNDFLFNKTCKPLGELYYEKYPRENGQKPNYPELYHFLLEKKIIDSSNCTIDNFRDMFKNVGEVTVEPINIRTKTIFQIALIVDCLKNSLITKYKHREFVDIIKERFHFFIIKENNKNNNELSLTPYELNYRSMLPYSINIDDALVIEVKSAFKKFNFYH